jgi:hypothetical protein
MWQQLAKTKAEGNVKIGRLGWLTLSLAKKDISNLCEEPVRSNTQQNKNTRPAENRSQDRYSNDRYTTGIQPVYNRYTTGIQPVCNRYATGIQGIRMTYHMIYTYVIIDAFHRYVDTICRHEWHVEHVTDPWDRQIRRNEAKTWRWPCCLRGTGTECPAGGRGCSMVQHIAPTRKCKICKDENTIENIIQNTIITHGMSIWNNWILHIWRYLKTPLVWLQEKNPYAAALRLARGVGFNLEFTNRKGHEDRGRYLPWGTVSQSRKSYLPSIWYWCAKTICKDTTGTDTWQRNAMKDKNCDERWRKSVVCRKVWLVDSCSKVHRGITSSRWEPKHFHCAGCCGNSSLRIYRNSIDN